MRVPPSATNRDHRVPPATPDQSTQAHRLPIHGPAPRGSPTTLYFLDALHRAREHRHPGLLPDLLEHRPRPPCPTPPSAPANRSFSGERRNPAFSSPPGSDPGPTVRTQGNANPVRRDCVPHTPGRPARYRQILPYAPNSATPQHRPQPAAANFPTNSITPSSWARSRCPTGNGRTPDGSLELLTRSLKREED